jgi:hypothetical protein
MFKTIGNMLIGAIVAASVGAAVALVGIPPIPATGPGLVDGTWLNGLAGGTNRLFQSGITAAGTNQATALQLPAGIALLEVDTAAASTGVALPQCVAGTFLLLSNAGAQTLSIYGSATANSLVTPAANDTINATAGSTAYTIATNTNAVFFCPKNGGWKAGKIS